MRKSANSKATRISTNPTEIPTLTGPNSLTVDEARYSAKQVKPKTSRAERDFARHLKSIARHVGEMINGFEPGNVEMLPSMTQLLNAYAQALKSWAVVTTEKMLLEVNRRDVESWRSLGTALSRQLKHDIESTTVGKTLRALLEEQVGLIQSLPTEAAERVHQLTLKGLENSTRSQEYREEIRRSGEVTESRAVLIARTEVARTASALTIARATHAGLTHYRWRTSQDGSVRPGHRQMEGKICEFAHPPAVNENGRIMYHHPGQIWNCRCWPEPLIELESSE